MEFPQMSKMKYKLWEIWINQYGLMPIIITHENDNKVWKPLETATKLTFRADMYKNNDLII